MPQTKHGEKPKYNGGISCVQQIIKTEGFRGFYRGMLSPLVGVSPMFAFCFLGYDLGKRFQTPARPNNEFSYFQIFFAGNVAGFFSSLILIPTERIKCLVQAQPLEVNFDQSKNAIKIEKKYSGTIDCLKKVYKEGGIRSVYKGTILTLLRDVPSTGFYFVTYEFLKEKFNLNSGRKDALAQFEIFFAGGMAGVVNWIFAYPADVAKSRFQTAPTNYYKNIATVYKEIMITSGIQGFFKGFTTVLIGAFLADAACFLGYEFAR